MLECVEEGREEKSESEIINSEIELTHTTTTITIITTTITITTLIIMPNRRYQQPTTTPTPSSPSSLD
jgi:preprotein translocase subunit SecF